MRTPDFNNLLQVLNCERPSRPTTFEFFLNQPLYEKLAGRKIPINHSKLENNILCCEAYAHAGYDFITVQGSDFVFPMKEVAHKSSRSMNDTAIIHDRATFEAYAWPDPDAADPSSLDGMAAHLPSGMKCVIWGPGGVLENVMQLVGYEDLCMMLQDDRELVHDLFAAVGSRFVRYYQLCANKAHVGALISNDDWGFNSQTLLSPSDMREFLFPWHRRIVEVIHAAGKPAILHSCGNLATVMDEIIDDLKYDGKHSYEDKICPVEEAYEIWGSRIAILGGIDLDFVCRKPAAEVSARAAAMLQRSEKRGSYALGSGNSIPEYVPDEQYFALITPATGEIVLPEMA